MTRRKLLLWGLPAVLGLAVVAGLLVLTLTDFRSEAEQQIKKIQPGMTRDQVRAAIGAESTYAEVTGLEGTLAVWSFKDDSRLGIYFDDAWLVVDSREFTPKPPSWLERIRDSL